ncbi:MAG: hypothetical protein GX094_01375 [Clostridiales bacterium]|nr:hypothetical protein [Clostridiales bacterium]
MSEKKYLNHLNGPVAGKDGLGRKLPMIDEVGPRRPDRYVGIFYFVHKGPENSGQPINVTEVLEKYPEASKDFNHTAWGPPGSVYHWGEPLFGYYLTDDEWVIRKHIEMLTYADIDFLVFDTTNRLTFKHNCKTIISILNEYVQEGWKVPQIVYYTNTRSGETIREIYEDIYKTGFCPDTWFCWEGKPLIIGMPEECPEEIRDFFTFRLSQWPTEPFKEGGFPWIAFERPQHVFRDKDGNAEVISVSVAQHPQIKFGDSAMYGEVRNRGRAFRDGYNDRTPGALRWGFNIAEQWEYAIEQDPKIIFVTGWNEWTMGRFKGPKDRPITFIDQANQEFSRDIEPMKGGHFDDYYMQLIDYIRRFKGVDPVPQAGAKKTIDIRGSFGQWEDVQPAYYDMPFGNVKRNHPGYGGVIYKNDGGNHDIDIMKIARDDKRLYFYVRTREPIVRYSFTPWMRLYLHIEGNDHVGWEGYQYALNLELIDGDFSIVHKSLGGWRWKPVGRAPLKVEGNEMMLSVSRELLGIGKGDAPFEIHFKWADSIKGDWSIEDLYLHGDTAPYGRLNFVYACK